jgi:hypothetical protein
MLQTRTWSTDKEEWGGGISGVLTRVTILARVLHVFNRAYLRVYPRFQKRVLTVQATARQIVQACQTSLVDYQSNWLDNKEHLIENV